MLFTQPPHIGNRVPLLSLMTIGLTFACQRDIPIPTEVPSSDPSDQWKDLLEQSVSKDGIDWIQIEAHRDILEQYVAWVGTIGPQSNRRSGKGFPRRGRTNYKLVHWVNAYNAWMMYSYLHNNKPSDLTDVASPEDYLWDQRIYIDGEYTSFSHVKHERIFADFQEPRLHFMLYDLTEDSPLPEFWTATTWKAKSKLVARTFMASEHGARKVDNGWNFNPMLKQYEKDFIDWSEHNTMCEYLTDITTGKLKLWLQEKNQTGCNLRFFEDSTKIPQSTQRNSPDAE